MTKSHRLAVLTLLLLTTTTAAASELDNGKAINGKAINGKAINGPRFETLAWNSTPLPNVWLDRSRINACDENWQNCRDDVTGAFVNATQVDPWGNPVEDATLLIRSKRQGSVLYTNDLDVTYYDVELQTWRYYKVGFTRYYYPVYEDICASGWAIPIDGQWDHTSGDRGDGGWASHGGFTFACTSGAIGKCIEQADYKPWLDYSSAMPDFGTDWLREYLWRSANQGWRDALEACVRMVRSDYCGNGVSFTVDGTGIAVYDTFDPPINPDEGNTLYGFEGTWGPDGALCVEAPRYEEIVGSASHCVCGNACLTESPLDQDDSPFGDPPIPPGGWVPFRPGQCHEVPANTLFNYSESLAIPFYPDF